jgi:serine/threonine protein kinase
MSLAPRSSPLIPGYWLDRYELLCPIASGGMAEAWVARLQGKFGFEKLVAIKTILPSFATDARFQRMFLDEARIASGIEHTNVAQTLDLGEERGVFYIVMEWVDGDALNKLYRALEVKGEKIPQGILLRIVADICGGLHAAHELRDPSGALLGVVHRDVSPQNILVSTRGEAKLIDFGVAKARDRVAGNTNAGILKGKIHYMAPEQALGSDVDRRADVWAIGALLYHLLTGRPPYEGANPLATLHLLAAGAPPPPLPNEVPEPVARVVRHALSHAVEERPATAAEMQAAIERAMVETNVATTVADVSRFVGVHLADRVTKRRQAIDLALRAALDRVRIRPLLELPRADSMLDISPPDSPVEPRASVQIEVTMPSVAPPAAMSTIPSPAKRPTSPAAPIVAEPIVSEPIVSDQIISELIVPDPVVPEPIAARPIASRPIVPGPIVPGPIVPGPIVPGPFALDPPLPRAPARGRVLAGIGAGACAVVALVLLVSRSGSVDAKPARAASAPAAIASKAPEMAASAVARPTASAPGVAEAQEPTPDASATAAAPAVPSGDPAPARPKARPKAPSPHTRIPEVIDNGF